MPPHSGYSILISRVTLNQGDEPLTYTGGITYPLPVWDTFPEWNHPTAYLSINMDILSSTFTPPTE